MEIQWDGDVLTARLTGEIDHHSAGELRRQIDEAVECGHPRELHLNFERVSFMDSSGIGLIMGRYRLMGTLNGTLRVEAVPPSLEKMMKLAGLERLPVWNTVCERKRV